MKLAENIVGLIRYRNALVHGQEMTVSVDIVQRVKATRDELQLQIQRRINLVDGNDEQAS